MKDLEEKNSKASGNKEETAFQQQVEAAHVVAKNVRLIDLLVTSIQCHRMKEQFNLSELVSQHRLAVEAIETKPVSKEFWAAIDIGQRFVRLDKKREVEIVAIEISAKYNLAYRLRSRRGITKKQVRDFCSINAVHTVWPFWREFVHSTAGRMGYLELLIPLRPPIRPPVREAEGRK